jgi:hypothetical protein
MTENRGGASRKIAIEYGEQETWVHRFEAFLAEPEAAQTEELSIGLWAAGGMSDKLTRAMLEALAGAASRLPRLRSLFIGDIDQEESEISWIQHGDLAPVLAAFPNLTSLSVYGANDLSLGTVQMPGLQRLSLENGGLNGEVVRQVARAEWPNLEYLDLYLGTEEYGASSAPEDLAPFLSPERFPKLRHLGLKNSDYQDQIAQMFAEAPILDQLDTLDLSMGTLSDEGGAALLSSVRVKGLKRLDLSHHFLSDEMMGKLEALGKFVDVSDQQEADEDDPEWRFVALGE